MRSDRLYFAIDPEAAGRVDPADRGLCVFDTWLGDDLVSAHPYLLVTGDLRGALDAAPGFSGFSFAAIRVDRSRFFREHTPNRDLPEFWNLQVRGVGGQQDFGMSAEGGLVVSLAALKCLARHTIRQATITQHVSQAESRLLRWRVG